jgi:hypothetical protein
VNRSLPTVLLGFALSIVLVTLVAAPVHAERKQPVRVVQTENLSGDPDHPEKAQPVRQTSVASSPERRVTQPDRAAFDSSLLSRTCGVRSFLVRLWRVWFGA